VPSLTRGRLYFVYTYAAGPCQRSFSRVRVPCDSRPYFTVSDLRLPFSSPLTTRWVTVEVFHPTSTRVMTRSPPCLPFNPSAGTVWKTQPVIIVEALLLRRCVATVAARTTENTVSNTNYIAACVFFAKGTCLPSRCPETVAAYRVIA
jgi:hypothetical protein